MSTLASFNSSPQFAFVASEKYARNFETEGIVDCLQGVEILFTTPGPLSAGIFDLNTNRFFMQQLYDRLIATEYPAPFLNGPNGSIDHWTVTAQQNASGQMVNITYTKQFNSNQASTIQFSRNNQPINEFVLARCVYTVRTALNSNPPRYNMLRASKFKLGLIGKKAPLCINSMVNGVSACDDSSLLSGEIGDGWNHYVTGVEVLPNKPDFGSLNTSWWGGRRLDVSVNNGLGLRDDLDPNLPGGEIGATPSCCAI